MVMCFGDVRLTVSSNGKLACGSTKTLQRLSSASNGLLPVRQNKELFRRAPQQIHLYLWAKPASRRRRGQAVTKPIVLHHSLSGYD